jgi:hypothetical protein
LGFSGFGSLLHRPRFLIPNSSFSLFSFLLLTLRPASITALKFEAIKKGKIQKRGGIGLPP